VIDSFEKIGFALSVIPVDEIEFVMKRYIELSISSEIPQI